MHPNIYSSTIHSRQTWKQPKCPSKEEWIRKMWYRYKWNITQPLERMKCHLQQHLEIIILSEVSQKEKHQYSILTHIYGI